jgi:hypothetical protein
VLAQPRDLPDPDRGLSAEEAEKLVSTVVVLLDKQAELGRRMAARDRLGVQFHHRAGVPALRAVMQDESEGYILRLNAMRDVLRIGPPEPLTDVIPLLRSADLRVRSGAHELLCAQYRPGREFGFVAGAPPEANELAIRKWEEWWRASKADFRLNPEGVWMSD